MTADRPGSGRGTRLEVIDGTAVITIDRPHRRNALDGPARAALLEDLAAAADERAVSAVVITGAGGTFSAGSDLDALAASDSTAVLRDEYWPIIRSIRSLPKPVLAAVEGVASGAGAGLALACDLVVASADARFDFPFARLGLIGDVGLHHHLASRVGRWRAAQLLWSASPLSAGEAAALGFVTRLVPAGASLAACRELAGSLAADLELVAESKAILSRLEAEGLEAAVLAEADGQGRLRRTERHRRTFLEWRRTRA